MTDKEWGQIGCFLSLLLVGTALSAFILYTIMQWRGVW